MFDPAAMGTLLIGLDGVDPERQTTRRHRAITSPRRGQSVRAALAQGLRRAAALLEPRTADKVGV
ncbi:MAG TPA: hypothetical protein VHK05_02140 [Candidatus Limnocylindrales bacterium]|jgi:hypothetical protein|nr:hypothetical protein [Candidatus Limnocylindrales bacterium]